MKKTTLIIALTFIVFGLYLTIDGTFTYWRGFHNIDLGQNIEYINKEYGMKLRDTAKVTSYSIFEKEEKSINMTGRDLIISGMDQSTNSFMELITGFFLIIISMCIFLIEK